MGYNSLLGEIAETTNTELKANESLARYGGYGTGGDADAIFFPDSEEKLRAIVYALNKSDIDYVFLGRGTNVLFSDDGYRGAIISTAKLKGITISGSVLKAMAGNTLAEVLDSALYNSLGGIEFLCGIPASVGGAVAMNAGCFGKSIGDFTLYVTALSGIYKRSECGFDYRTSRFLLDNDCVLSACFNLDNVEYDQAENKAEYFTALRRSRQPKGRSLGSVFKNDGYYAGKVIESCGLKGFSVGKARVSEKHANFIITENGATSRDISRLIAHIKETVKQNTGVELKEEIRYIGKFEDGDNLRSAYPYEV